MGLLERISEEITAQRRAGVPFKERKKLIMLYRWLSLREQGREIGLCVTEEGVRKIHNTAKQRLAVWYATLPHKVTNGALTKKDADQLLQESEALVEFTKNPRVIPYIDLPIIKGLDLDKKHFVTCIYPMRD